MKAHELMKLIQDGMGEYAKLAVSGYIYAVNEGDTDFDSAFFADFFSFVTKDTSSLENADFCALFSELVNFSRDVLVNSDDFENDGQHPIGISAYDATRLAFKMRETALFDVLTELKSELELYEYKYDLWEQTEESDADYGMSDSDFLDFSKANLIR